MWRKFPRLIKSVGLVALIIVALSVTVIGVPIAIWLGVRWMFTAQATMLDDAGVQASLGRSTAAVRGRWWRVALVSLSLFILGAAPGVLVGLVLLIFGSAVGPGDERGEQPDLHGDGAALDPGSDPALPEPGPDAAAVPGNEAAGGSVPASSGGGSAGFCRLIGSDRHWPKQAPEDT